MNVTLVSTGGGRPETMTAECARVLEQAQCVIGAERLLNALPDQCTARRVKATRPADVCQAVLDCREETSNSARSFQCADSGSPHRPAVAELEPGFRTQRGMRSGGRGVQWQRDVFSHRFAQCVGAVCAALRGGLG